MRTPLPEGAGGNSGRLVPRGGARRSRGEAGRGRGAGPSARGAGEACDHARGAGRAVPRGGGGGESNGGRGRLRGGCAAGAAAEAAGAAGSAGWAVASAARAGPLVAVRPLCQPRRRAGTSGERPLRPRPRPDNGGSGRAAPLLWRPPGRAPQEPGARAFDLAGARRGRPWSAGRCPGVCGAGTPRGARARRAPLWFPLGEPADGQRPENLPRAWDLLVRGSCPGCPAPVRGERGGPRRQSQTSPSRTRTRTGLSSLRRLALRCFV